jgi:hypothetical protein
MDSHRRRIPSCAFLLLILRDKKQKQYFESKVNRGSSNYADTGPESRTYEEMSYVQFDFEIVGDQFKLFSEYYHLFYNTTFITPLIIDP